MRGILCQATCFLSPELNRVINSLSLGRVHCHIPVPIFKKMIRKLQQSHILPHMLYPPHRHEYTCIICPTRMHVVAYSAHLLYLPHRHEYICIICHTCMHTGAYFATQAVSATQA